MKKNYNFKTKLTLLYALMLLAGLNSYSQTIIFEDFETAIGTVPASGYVTREATFPGGATSANVVEFNLNNPPPAISADFFGRASLSELNNTPFNVSNVQGNRFFGVQDADQSGNPNGNTDNLSINWFNIDVSSISQFNASAFFAIEDGGLTLWDDDTSVRFEYSTNNTNWTTFFAIESEGPTNTVAKIDSPPFDGVGDGALLTSTFTEYTSIDVDVSTINTISVRIVTQNFSLGRENILFDNFTMKAAVPADTTPPTVSTIIVNGSPAANATSVSYNVTFSEAVTGVDVSDFTVDGSGVTGSIANVTGSGTSYVVTVGSVSGTGTLSIDLNAISTNIIDTNSNAISGGFTAGNTHTVDTDAPILTSSNPIDNAINVIVDSNIELTFSENISKGTGNLVIKRTSDDSTIETIDVTTSTVSIASNIATINPISDLDLNTEYYIQIDNTAFKDIVNNNYAGISDMTSLSFTTESTLSNNENDIATFRVYPNPVKNILNINNAKDIENVDIYNLLGQNVASFNKKTIINNTLNLIELPKGIYLVKIHAGNKTKTIKILKQ